jgi:hypothetical protein
MEVRRRKSAPLSRSRPVCGRGTGPERGVGTGRQQGRAGAVHRTIACARFSTCGLDMMFDMLLRVSSAVRREAARYLGMVTVLDLNWLVCPDGSYMNADRRRRIGAR